MTKFLINLGLVLTPFVVIPGIDVRDIKMTVASLIASALGLSGLRDGMIKPLSNKWFYYFVFYAVSCYIFAPNPALCLLGMNVGYFWVWQPMFNFLVFALAIVVISSIEFTGEQLDKTLRIMTMCGFLMACYVILQRLGIDQFFDNVGADHLGRMAGFVGNPTHVSPFIGMLLPLALHQRKYLFAGIMSIAIVCTTSQVAIGSTIIGIALYYALRKKRDLFGLVLVGVLVITTLSIMCKNDTDFYLKLRGFAADNQRFMVYEQVIKDVNSKPFEHSNMRYPLTGWGMGNFKYTFHFAHADNETFMRFHQVHNEYLEILYNIGIVGFVLFMLMLYTFFKEKAIRFYNSELSDLERALLSGFVLICIVAFGTFAWQIGTLAFYSVVIVGLLNNKSIVGGVR